MTNLIFQFIVTQIDESAKKKIINSVKLQNLKDEKRKFYLLGEEWGEEGGRTVSLKT